MKERGIKPPAPGVTMEQVRELVNRLRNEFRDELRRIEDRLGSLEQRVDKLERERVTGIPKLSVDGSAAYTIDLLSDAGADPDSFDWPGDRYGYLRADLNLGFRVSEDWNANVHLLWVNGTENNIRDTARLDVREATLVGPSPFFGGQLTLGRQFVKYGYGLLLDNQFSGFDGIRWDRSFGSIDLSLLAADVDIADPFRGYRNSALGAAGVPEQDGVFGARLGFGTDEDRWHIGVNALYTGIGDYQGWSVDAHYDIFPQGAYLNKIRAEWVYTTKDANDNDIKESLWWVDLNILNWDWLKLDFTWADSGTGFAPHIASVLNPFYLSRAELLFRPGLPAAGAVTPAGVMLQNIIDFRLRWRIFGNWLNVRWFQGDDGAGNDLGNVITVGYEWELRKPLRVGLWWGMLDADAPGNDRQWIRASVSYSF